MRILNYHKFKLLEFKNTDILSPNTTYNLSIKDSNGTHFLEVILESHGYSLHRHITNYEFRITKSSSKDYNIEGRIILGLEFNKKTNQFLYYPFWFDKTSRSQTNQLIKKGFIELY